MSYLKDPKVEFKIVTFNSEQYLYIKEIDPNIKETEDRESWAYIQLKEFWMKKQAKVLQIGNHLGIIYTLTGNYESIVNEWVNRIKTVTGFP